MAKPDKMPQQTIIDGFKGLIDFYYWKGIAVARRWPRYYARTPTPAEATNQADFAYINKLYSTLPAIIIDALQDHATGTTQVPKDYLVRAYLKGLFELMPPEYYATEETLLDILARLDVDLSTRALELGGHLARASTSLQLIDDFADPLNTIWAYNDRYAQNLDHPMTEDADYAMPFEAVPEDEVWVIEAIAGRSNARALWITHEAITVGDVVTTLQDEQSAAGWRWVFWTGQVVLKYQDRIRIYFAGNLDTDVLYGQVWGYKMKI